MRETLLAIAILLSCLCLPVGLPGGSAMAEDAWVFTTFAGIPPGSADGVGSAARLYFPWGMAVDSAGNVFVADFGNHTIRKITPAGFVSTWAGVPGTPGYRDGNKASALFEAPHDVAIDPSGNVYVADAHSRVIRKITPAGNVTTLAGLAGSSGSIDGTGSNARFVHPGALGVDAQGNIYVADEQDHTIRKVTPAGVVTTLAGRTGSPGTANGSGASARFDLPRGIETEADGTCYVADTRNHTIRKIAPNGMVTTLAGTADSAGNADGVGASARFNSPMAVAVDAAGNLFVTEGTNHTVRKVTRAGVVSTLAGLAGASGSNDGSAFSARFNIPSGICVDRQGNVFVADTYNHTVRRVTQAGVVTTVAGLTSPGSNDGGPGVARFAQPQDVQVDLGGNVIVTDALNHTIRKITPGGEVTTLAGLAGAWGPTDGKGSAARFRTPNYLALAPNGDIYVSDRDNSAIRKVRPDGTVSLVAGKAGYAGSNDGTGSSAMFRYPTGLAVDAAGNVIVADSANATIRKVTPAGVVTTIAGLAGSTGSSDGTGTAARLERPTGVAIAPGGNIFISDIVGSTLRKVTPGGAVTTVAGMPRQFGTVDGKGSAARFQALEDIAFDPEGIIVGTDFYGETVRRITPAFEVSTIAGSPLVWGATSGIGSNARFDSPAGIDVDDKGVIYLADRYTNTIRRGVRCTGGALCALDGRFQITLAARDSRSGTTGPGVPLQQNDLFGFFSIPALTSNPGNPEVFVKMLDGRALNGKFWVFYGGLTDFEYTLTVKDVVSGETKSYAKPSGSSAGGFDVGSGVTPENCAGNVAGTSLPPVAPGPCSAGNDRLCLNSGRFKIEIAARDPRTGNRGAGTSIPQGDLFGYFAIPALTGNASNPEVFVKVLDGRALNGYFWIFFSGLTDLEYTMTVTDTVTGGVKSYTKAGGSACGAFDTSAF